MKKVILSLALLPLMALIAVPVFGQFPGPGDIIITEIMSDPSPPVSLPQEEYLEILNRSGDTISLSGWSLKYSGQSSKFPVAVIYPGEYIILCSVSDTAQFNSIGRTIGLKSFPPLTDSGRWLTICDSRGSLVHGIEYTDNWYGDALKEEGGWSLEMIDTGYPFNFSDNWKASKSSSGGTPGRKNSVAGYAPDFEFYGLTDIFPLDAGSVRITFSEPVINMDLCSGGIKVDGVNTVQAASSDPLNRVFSVVIGQELLPGKVYNISLPAGLRDYSGNIIQKRIKPFGLPEKAVHGDIVFNEILFNPLPGGSDFIELYNNSGKTVDLSSIFAVSVNDTDADTTGLYPVSPVNRCFLPGSYFAASVNRNQLLEQYFSAVDTNILETGDLPSMPDDEGHIILYDRKLTVIDEMKYSDEMHFRLISDAEGISLEKANPSLDSENAGSWKSASESSGWATPGARNSIYTIKPACDDIIQLSSSRISPDNDGYEDVLVIDLKLNGTSNVVNIAIYDETGMAVKRLANNLFAAAEASVAWDGTAGDGSLLNRGIYIIMVTVFDENGKYRNWKKSCVVIR
jgi:hypothetical protein